MSKDLMRVVRNIGLEEHEAQVYLAGLELGETSVQRLAKKTGIKRTTVYRVVDSLKEKGLYSTVIAKGHKKYLAESPRILLDKTEQQKKDLEEAMPELESLVNYFDKKPEVRYFEGDDGIKEVYNDTLRSPDSEILSWVNSEAVSNFDIRYLRLEYLPKRLRKKIQVRAIAPATEEMKRYQGRDVRSLRQTKLMEGVDSFNVEVRMYDKDKVSVVDFKERMGLIIRNKNIFETFKKIFENNWQNL